MSLETGLELSENYGLVPATAEVPGGSDLEPACPERLQLPAALCLGRTVFGAAVNGQPNELWR